MVEPNHQKRIMWYPRVDPAAIETLFPYIVYNRTFLVEISAPAFE
jgi:hypothetical protein